MEALQTSCRTISEAYLLRSHILVAVEILILKTRAIRRGHLRFALKALLSFPLAAADQATPKRRTKRLENLMHTAEHRNKHT